MTAEAVTASRALQLPEGEHALTHEYLRCRAAARFGVTPMALDALPAAEAARMIAFDSFESQREARARAAFPSRPLP